MRNFLTLFLRLITVSALVIASLGGVDLRLLQTVATSTAAEPQTPAGATPANSSGDAITATSTVLSGTVTVDAISTGQVSGATTLTVAHSTGSSANRLMLVGVSINRETGATNDKVTGITYSGQALTLVGAKTDGGSGEARVEMWALKNPPTGAANVVVTFNRANDDGAVVGVATFAGVDQTTPYGAFFSNSGNGTMATLSVTSAAGELVFDTVTLRSVGFGASGSPGAGQTARWKTYFNSRVGAGGSTESGAATVTMSWTAASAVDWAIGALAIKPAQTPQIAITKTLTTPAPIYAGQEISFTIRITNTGPSTVTVLPLGDWYDSTTLSFVSAVPQPNTAVTGTLTWNDLTTALGDLAPGQAVAVVTRFQTLKATTVVLSVASAALTSEAAGEAMATSAPDLVAPSWAIEVWPTATCSGWQILFQRASGSGAENWRAKVDGTIIASGTTNGNNETVTGAWPASLDLTTSHTFRAEIYEGSKWLYREVTFGNCPPPATASIGDRVFYDLDGSGLPDGGSEPGINGVTVRLFSNTCTGTPLATATTAGSGGYSFTSLVAGTYCVHVDPSTVPAGYQLTTGNIPLTVSLAAGQNYTTADFGYRVQCPNGTPNLALVKGAVDATGTVLKDYQSYACAEIQPARATIGDYVWNDTNGDGIQNEGAGYGINGVILALYRDDGDNVFEPGAGDTLALTRTTAADGGYQFTNVVPGAYWVDVPAENPFLTGYTFIPGTQSGPDPKLVTVGANDTYTTADFGYAGKGLISGVVFYDWNRDGIQDLNEGPITTGVEVCLYQDNNRDGLLDGGDTELTCMTTGDGGTYAFAGQVAGAYLVVQTQPAGLQTTTPNLLPVTLVVVGTNGSAPDNNFGEIVYVRLGDMVYVDINGNGSQEPGETVGLTGVQLQLTGTNIRGDSVNWTTVTMGNGHYLTDTLLPGTYTVKAPPQYGGFQLTSPAAQTTTLTIVITEDLTLDFGYVFPTGVGVLEFKAAVGPRQVTLSWLAFGEQPPSFHVRRADNSKGVGAVPVTGQPVTSGTGAYQFVDRGVVAGQTYWYTLEDANTGQTYGPLAVTVAPMSIRAFLPMLGQ